jgi:hypothetical protein
MEGFIEVKILYHQTWAFLKQRKQSLPFCARDILVVHTNTMLTFLVFSHRAVFHLPFPAQQRDFARWREVFFLRNRQLDASPIHRAQIAPWKRERIASRVSAPRSPAMAFFCFFKATLR